MRSERFLSALRVRVMAELEARQASLAEAAVSLPPVAVQITRMSAELRRLDRALDAYEAELRLSFAPFSASMSMHVAWSRHPGAASVFARHHLPACDRCAVRFDESIGEAAAAYGLDLAQLLAELNALLEGG